MAGLREGVAHVAAETNFSGVVRVDRAGETLLEEAFGLAERSFGVPNTVETRFGLASGCKGLTAVTALALVAEGSIALDTPVQSLLGGDLPEVDAAVTIEHLLAHRSGIGDYLDEDEDLDLADYLMPVPVHQLATTEDYLQLLGGHPAKFPAGEKFSYCNSGYVLLALIVERVTGQSFYDVVADRVLHPAGMADTAYLRSDELPGDTARGYLAAEGLRTNVLHLPVRGSGDGGVYSTLGDVHRFWHALLGGSLLPDPWVEELLRPRSDVPGSPWRCGLGFMLPWRDAALLEGHDAGVSFRSVRDRAASVTWTVVSNTTDGAWPIARHLREHVHD